METICLKLGYRILEDDRDLICIKLKQQVIDHLKDLGIFENTQDAENRIDVKYIGDGRCSVRISELMSNTVYSVCQELADMNEFEMIDPYVDPERHDSMDADDFVPDDYRTGFEQDAGGIAVMDGELEIPKIHQKKTFSKNRITKKTPAADQYRWN